MVKNSPWAILLCRYSDDKNNPATTKVADLYAQWKKAMTAQWMQNNITSSAEFDNRTILELYENLFTITGAFTFNIPQYFDRMSHGSLDLSGSRVFVCDLDLTWQEGQDSAASKPGKPHQNDMFVRAKKALSAQHGVDWKDYAAIAVSFPIDDAGGNQGDPNYDGGPGVIADIRWVRNNGASLWCHEMCHAYGLNHSRTNGQLTSNCTGGDPSDYTDDWDVMSFACCKTTTDSDYGTHGPGLNAWNMRGAGWLNESRVWKAAPNTDFAQLLTLTSLHRRESAGYLAAELPGIGADSSYLVELRQSTGWDQAFGAPAVLVHRFAPPNSYLMKGTGGQKVLGSGDRFEIGVGPISGFVVKSIDGAAGIATVLLYHSSSARVAPGARISGPKASHCKSVHVAGTMETFHVAALGALGLLVESIEWKADGASIVGASNAEHVVLEYPAVAGSVSLGVQLRFDNNEIALTSLQFGTIAPSEAALGEMICHLAHELRPIPWWKWQPDELVRRLRQLPRADLHAATRHLELLGKAVQEAVKGHSG